MSDDQTVTGPGRQTRRALLAGAGAVGASVVLAACGTADDDALDGRSGGEPAGALSGDDATGSPAGGGAALAKTSEIPVGGGKIIAEREVVVTQPTEGQFKAFSAICTHQGCPVTSVDGGTINCSCHFSKFSITDGSVKGGPATTPLAAKTITVTGDEIVLA